MVDFFETCMQVLVTSFGELEDNAFLDPRTAQVAIVDHVKQVSVFVSTPIDFDLIDFRFLVKNEY
jgi:hypothetical protein